MASREWATGDYWSLATDICSFYTRLAPNFFHLEEKEKTEEAGSLSELQSHVGQLHCDYKELLHHMKSCLSKVAALDYLAVRSQIQLDKLEAAILDKTRKRDLQTDLLQPPPKLPRN